MIHMNQWKICICKSDIDRNAKSITDTIMSALYQNNETLPFLERVYKVFPELEPRIFHGQSYDEILEVVTGAVQVRFQKEQDEIQAKITHFEELANKKLLPAVCGLLELFEIEQKKEEVVTCYLGLFNPFPRDVLKKEYCIHYDVSDEIFLRSSLHEMNHMILFDKWKSMHGYDSKNEPTYPDALWYLEELAIEPTLNNDKMQKLLPIRHQAYNSFYRTKVQGMALPEHIQKIYDESSDIVKFLDNAFAFIGDNMEEILCGK